MRILRGAAVTAELYQVLTDAVHSITSRTSPLAGAMT
jgi:hypothetical protein